MLFKFAAAAQAGTGHRELDLPCQDSVAAARTDTAACITLADGAGSCEQSELAAQAVTRTLAADLAGHFDWWYAMPDRELAAALLQQARLAVQAAAPDTPAACTLLLAAQAADGRCLLAHIGDGCIIGAGAQGARTLLSQPENGEEPGLTFFLSGADAAAHLRILRDPDPRWGALLLCSDGAGAALVRPNSGEIGLAPNILAQWLQTMPERTVAGRLQVELDGLFRQYTADDMSAALMLRPLPPDFAGFVPAAPDAPASAPAAPEKDVPEPEDTAAPEEDDAGGFEDEEEEDGEGGYYDEDDEDKDDAADLDDEDEYDDNDGEDDDEDGYYDDDENEDEDDEYYDDEDDEDKDEDEDEDDYYDDEDDEDEDGDDWEDDEDEDEDEDYWEDDEDEDSLYSEDDEDAEDNADGGAGPAKPDTSPPAVAPDAAKLPDEDTFLDDLLMMLSAGDN